MIKARCKPVFYILAALLVMVAIVSFSPSELGAKAANGVVVVIDSGHGVSDKGYDNGATGVGELKEAEVNRQLASKIVQQLKSRGYTVYTTFPIVDGVPSLLPYTPGTSLATRVAAVNALGPDLFMSVHHNSNGPKAEGMIVLVDSGQDVHGAAGMYQVSRSLASYVYNSVAELRYTVGNRAQTIVDQGASVLRYNRAPAITLEADFITNANGAARAKDETYQQNMAIKVADGIDKFVVANNIGGSKDVTPPTAQKAYASTYKTPGTPYHVEVSGVADSESGVSKVQFVTYIQGKQPQTENWQNGVDLGGGKWGQVVRPNEAPYNNRAGTYVTEVFATDGAGNTARVGVITVEVEGDSTPPTAQKAYASISKTKAAPYHVEVSGVTDSSGISKVQFVTYIQNSQGKQMETETWQNGADLGGGKWGQVVRPGEAPYNNRAGTYITEVFATDNAGNTARVGVIEVEVEGDSTPPTAQKAYASISKTKAAPYHVEVSGVTDPSGISKVQFVTYIQGKQPQTENWQNGVDLGGGKWGQVIRPGEAPYNNSAGTYITEVFATDNVGNSARVGVINVEVEGDSTPPTAQKAYANTYSTTASRYNVEVSGVTDGESGVAKVQFVTYIQGKQPQTENWKNGVDLGGGKWGQVIDSDVAPFGAQSGTYITEVFATDNVGNSARVGVIKVEVDRSNTQPQPPVVIDPNEYVIMGSTAAQKQQLINYFNSRAAFPSYYNMTLAQFVDIYWEEAAAEGVKPEVAFAQMIHETGFLRFGNQVNITQFNFCGLKNTNGVGFASFPEVRIGIRAQIQHLKCYASTEGLNNALVDTRWSLVTRGCAPTVEQLSNRWAGPAYGPAVRNYINQILSSSTASVASTMTAETEEILTILEPAVDDANEPVTDEVAGAIDEVVDGEEEDAIEAPEEPDNNAEDVTEGIIQPDAGENNEQPNEAEDSPKDAEGAEPEDDKTSARKEEPEYGILGDSSAVTKEQLVGLFVAGNQNENPVADETAEEAANPLYDENGFPLVYGMTLEQFVDMYFETAIKNGVRPEVAFVQAMSKTGFLGFAATPDMDIYNMGGLEEGVYQSLEEGMAAQMDSLKLAAGEETLAPEMQLVVELAKQLAQGAEADAIIQQVNAG
ncbi:MAG: N-acetylmuramoyl-L-alanine amidase [Christensenellaceae bacterium]|jgi:N-acetylmuramoyl-L-alanine amidase